MRHARALRVGGAVRWARERAGGAGGRLRTKVGATKNAAPDRAAFRLAHDAGWARSDRFAAVTGEADVPRARGLPALLEGVERTWVRNSCPTSTRRSTHTGVGFLPIPALHHLLPRHLPQCWRPSIDWWVHTCSKRAEAETRTPACRSRCPRPQRVSCRRAPEGRPAPGGEPRRGFSTCFSEPLKKKASSGVPCEWNSAVRASRWNRESKKHWHFPRPGACRPKWGLNSRRVPASANASPTPSSSPSRAVAATPTPRPRSPPARAASPASSPRRRTSPSPSPPALPPSAASPLPRRR